MKVIIELNAAQPSVSNLSGPGRLMDDFIASPVALPKPQKVASVLTVHRDHGGWLLY